MRLLAVDFGFTRIGLAVGETDPAVCTPRPAMQASGALKRDAEALVAYAKKEEVQAIVLGLPIEESGEEGRMARICRTLAGHIEALGTVVKLVDERMTSVEAERLLRDTELKASQRRKLRDGEAAVLILERYLNDEETAS